MINITTTESFDISSLQPSFNKRVDIKRIYNFIEKKYSLNETTKFALVCFYKKKSNVVLITLSNEKVFIFSNKKDLDINGVYSYNDIESFAFLEKKKKTFLTVNTKQNSFVLRNITKYEYDKLTRTFDELKEEFNNTQIGQNILNNFNTFSSMDFIKKRVLYKEEQPNSTSKILGDNQPDQIVINFDDEKTNLDTTQQNTNKKNKRVVNDKNVTPDTSFSSLYIFELFSRLDKKLPGGNPTILNELANRLYKLEKSNPFDNHLDAVSFKLSSLSKLNTIPVIAEFSNINDKDITENRLLFARNWIEYTKHNVKNKLLGVDKDGNGAYIDMNQPQSTKQVDVFKAREYLIDDNKRHGLRSNQTISAKEKKGLPGIDSLYRNVKNDEKLDITKYDGIIFLGQKYYFNVVNEFSTLQRKYCKIINHEWKTNGSINRTFELLFEDDLITYKVFNEKGIVFDDLDKISSSFDLKWLTFFKD